MLLDLLGGRELLLGLGLERGGAFGARLAAAEGRDLAAAGYNFRRLLAWLRFLLLRILIALGLAAQFKLA